MKTFRLSTLLLMPLALFVVTVVPAQAQNWSAEEQEILDFTEACWETFAEEDVVKYLSECAHDDYTRWTSGASMPFDSGHERAMLPPWFSRNDWVAWDIQPHRIKVSGEAAVIQYQFVNYRSSTEGSTWWVSGGRSDFLVREGGVWKIFGAHEHASE